MRPRVRIARGQVRVRYGALRLDFPDTPAHWLALFRALQEFGDGSPDEVRG